MSKKSPQSSRGIAAEAPRGITAEDTTLPASPEEIISEKSLKLCSKETVAGILLALIRDCDQISSSVSDAAVAFPFDRWTEIRLPNKTLRLLYGELNRRITLQMVRNQTHKLPENHEWLILADPPLTDEAKTEINHRDEIHYIDVTHALTWTEIE